ncbi:hypothetical protein AGABI2DRAFT_115687 [Agaricus bisporus var. bisporus H97]|uniref:hypothetical protein n=1 Tax=Agaricus bisporus var. bisporus (strain H97 / ATCC MYA-4626 / FGSC 10389) TaxID=936046 RepID=UPI00029F7120|nr:hypothetical protein AGABI2DRAFT_115687 [Agaricus bisporus var. bisporus H97]EKV50611.1 hypothetical protein AGABI2DRAFT_115687 [Agaricus bisporus var. bisporus H97]
MSVAAQTMSSIGSVVGTYGALFLGGFFASILSGLVALQVLVYFKLYNNDPRHLKTLVRPLAILLLSLIYFSSKVLTIWVIDMFHTGLVIAGLWDYLIKNFGHADRIGIIPWTLSVCAFYFLSDCLVDISRKGTVAVTGILTCIVHFFYSHRIFRLSRQNYFIAVPICILAVCRLVSASATTAEMVLTGSFLEFRSKFYWLFTLGLGLSSVVDIIVTCSLFLLLRRKRTANFNVDAVFDLLILYAFETGSLTAAGTVLSMICWLTMSNNLIFMGLHFVIAKLYANSLLVALNTRREIRRASHKTPMGIQFAVQRTVAFEDIRSPKVTISVEHSVHQVYDEELNAGTPN